MTFQDLKKQIVNITQLYQLKNLEICESDINWSKVKMNNYRWIAIRHKKISYPNTKCDSPSTSYKLESKLYNSSFRNSSSDNLHNICMSYENNTDTDEDNDLVTVFVPQIENSITIVNPYTNQTYNCQTSGDTKCAQMSPEDEIIAISNERFIAVYCVQKSLCLNTLPFPSKCIFWNWINNNVIAIITEREVFHWDMNYPFEPQLKFKLDQRIKNNQITDYKCDQSHQLWFAISSLYVDDEGEINGFIQIYSEPYKQTQCIEAHTCSVIEYKFNGNMSATKVLLAAKRNQMNTFKIYIIELGPPEEGNSALISRTEVIPVLEQLDYSRCDFPVSIQCDPHLGLIYIFSKYGSMYVCDIESGALLISAAISPDIVFETCFDCESQGVIAISRNGQVLSIELSLSYLIEYLNSISKKDTAQRIQLIIENQYNDSDCDEVTRL